MRTRLASDLLARDGEPCVYTAEAAQMLFKPRSIQSTARTHKRMVRAPNPMHDRLCRKHARDNNHQTNTSLTACVIHDCPCYGIARACYIIACECYRSGADACASETEASYNACQYHILSTYRTLYTSTRPLAPAPTRSPHATRPSELRTPRGRHGIARTRCISRTCWVHMGPGGGL